MDDLEFVRRCCQGQSQAREEFLSRYCRLIYNYIHSVLRSQGNTAEKDFVSDIYHDIIASLLKDRCKKLRGFKARNSASLATWLRQVTINHCLSHLRKIKSADIPFNEQAHNGLNLSNIIPFRSLPISDQAAQDERLDQLTVCIQALDIEDRFFLELHMRRGLRLEELKDYFTVSRGAVDMRKSRILARLRDCFKEHGFEVP